MTRPIIRRRINFRVSITEVIPVCKAVTEQVFLNFDELEALRLKDLLSLEQEKAAEMMQISQPTFSRIIDKARKKVADAIINGKALKIGDYNHIQKFYKHHEDI